MPKQGFVFSREPMESKREMPETLPCEMTVLDTKVAHPEKRGDSPVQPRKHGPSMSLAPTVYLAPKNTGKSSFPE